ncbi:MAG: M6 family metalloprotease domain-containing protein [Bacteroidetes bacterium]|nr:M6 family metalloprotease domain-containing protein [Bacteroidota bacterium]
MKKLFLISILFLLFFTSRAAYFERLPYTITQPDGKKFSCFVSGDEFFNWIHDTEGYTIIQAPNGYFYYAVPNGDILKPSKYLVNSLNPASVGLAKWAKISESEYQRRREEMFGKENISNNFSPKAPHSGVLNNIVIYIRFSDDDEFTTTRQDYDNDFNPPSGISLKSYYTEVSYGNLTINSSHYPYCAMTTNLSYQDSHPRGYFQPFNATTNTIGYTGIDNGSDRTAREHQLLADAVNWINTNSPIPSSLNIDGDGDNNVDNVCFIVKGNCGAWSSLLWAHRWFLSSQNVYINNKKVYDYTFQPENQVAVETLCHEMFHALGAPDLYHYTNQGVISPVGSWDLMESGGGHMLAYMKWRYSNHIWINSIPEITTSGTYTLKPLTSSINNCYKIASPYSTNEFFMVEYRNKTGTFESNIPGSGLIVYRIDTTLNGNANGPPDGVYLYRPGGTLTVNGNTNIAHYSSSVGRTAINDNSNPKCFLQTGGIGGLNISNITNPDTTISFDVSFPLPCSPPTTQASVFTSSALTNFSMTIGFTRGNGDSVLILAKASNPVNATPVNGISYAADTSFGNGIQIGSGNYVVYKGTGSVVHLSSLSSGTTFYYAVFEYNSTTKCYQTPALTGNATTFCIPLSITSQPIFSQTSCTPSTSISFSVASTGSTPINYKWQYNNNGTWANVTNGIPTGAIYTNTNTSTMSVVEITNADTHQYRCKLSNCNSLNKDTSDIVSLIINQTPPTPVITQIGNTLISDATIGNQWYSLSTGYISGATGSSYSPSQTGNYFVIVTINDCESLNKSNIIYFDNTGIIEKETNYLNINISPNPFTDKTTFTYTIKESEQVRISIFDVTGREIKLLCDSKQTNGEHSIVFEDKKLREGIYYYKICVGDKASTGKLILTK